MRVLKRSFENAMMEELASCTNQLDVTDLVARIMKKACDAKQLVDVYSLPEIMDHADVRKYYTEGRNSIVMNLPCPTVDLILSTGTCQFASADLEQLLNYSLAWNPQCYFYEAGKEDDWDPSNHQDNICSYRHQVISAEFFQNSYKRVKKMLTESLIPRNTRVVFARAWSDGYEAHNVVPNNEYNSIQAVTFKLMGGKDVTFPAMLVFKKHADKSLALTLIYQAKKLEKLMERYLGDVKTTKPTIVFTEGISNDLPEGHYNTQTSFYGTYSKRFGYSCAYDESVPSCFGCLTKRGRMLLDGSCKNEKITPCRECKDWWRDVAEASELYPVAPDFEILNMKNVHVPNVKLSFNMIENSLSRLYEWYGENENRKDSKKVVDLYIKLLCIGSPDDLASELRKSCKECRRLED